MELRELLLNELDQELKSTRATLQRVPEDKFDWKPHEKSFSMGDLAAHIANLLNWTTMTVELDSYDVAPEGENPAKAPSVRSTAELLNQFEKGSTAAREAIAKCGDDLMWKPWSMLAGSKEIFTLPRFVVLRSFILNHLVHHRAQLGVYLRICGIPVPSVYGPTADEAVM